MNEKNYITQKYLKESQEMNRKLMSLREKLTVKLQDEEKFNTEIENFKIVISEGRQNLNSEVEKSRVFLEENKHLHNKIEKLNDLVKENQHLKNQIENYSDFSKENAILRTEIDNSKKLAVEKQSLEKEMEDLIEKNQKYNHQAEHLEIILQEESQKLRNELANNNLLSLKNQQLDNQNQNMKNEIDLYQQKIDELMEENNYLKIEHATFQSENEKKFEFFEQEKDEIKIQYVKENSEFYNFKKQTNQPLVNGFKEMEQNYKRKEPNNFVDYAINNFLEIQIGEKHYIADQFLEEEILKLLEKKTNIIEELRKKAEYQKNSSIHENGNKKERILTKANEISDLKAQNDKLKSKLNKFKGNIE